MLGCTWYGDECKMSIARVSVCVPLKEKGVAWMKVYLAYSSTMQSLSFLAARRTGRRNETTESEKQQQQKFVLHKNSGPAAGLIALPRGCWLGRYLRFFVFSSFFFVSLVPLFQSFRRYGTIQHAGFGLGFERLVMFATGIENIRDVIPFPRYPGHASF